MLEKKYIELILNRCLVLENNNSLFINYDAINKKFVDKIVNYAKKIGIKDIYLDEVDHRKEHNLLSKMSISEIKNSKIFNCQKWDEYAKKNAAFLIIETEFPNLMNDIDSKKIATVSLLRRKTKPLYRKKVLKSLIPWCIVVMPNRYWAKDLFPNSKTPSKDFWNILTKICKLNYKDPIKKWNQILKERELIQNKLNNLEISKLYYKNSLGTNLTIELPKNALWQSSCCGEWIANFPSYEIFTTPNYKKTEGIVYSAKPLIYNGKIIKDFYVEFKNGKVINFDAKEGKDVLKEIINSDTLSSYLGEVALVNYNSPISKSNIIFKTTLLDENASCHIALGSGFLECIKDGEKLNKEELENIGINLSKNHVDFMIGTKDLTITADTNCGKKTIMKDGNLVI